MRKAVFNSFRISSILSPHWVNSSFSLTRAAQSFENQVQSRRENKIKMETSSSLLSVLVLVPFVAVISKDS